MVAEVIPSNSSAGLQIGPTRPDSVCYSARSRESHSNLDAQMCVRVDKGISGEREPT